ncbi:MAG TPA: tetratricopeptide repeat protein [Saprospiraceae bacterium]|nr:tetratricopeptide repeat protein [Saprospiraceae bacterium]
MSKTKTRLVLLISLCWALHAGSAWGQQITQAAAELEKMFVEACRERAIGNYEKAVPLLEGLLKKDNKNHAAMYELARVYDAQNKYAEAEKLMVSATALSPENNWYKKFLADVYQKTNKFLSAATLYEQLVKNDAHNDAYYYRWAYFLVKADAIDRAIKVYDELEKNNGISEESVRRKHSLYLGLGNNKKAAEELQRLIAAYPKRTEYRHLLAGFYEQIGDTAKAQAEYRQILSIAPNDSRAQLALAGNGRNAANDDIAYLRALKPVFENPAANIDQKIGKIIPFIQKVADTRNTELADVVLELTSILEKAHPGEAKPLAAAGDLFYYTGRKKEALAKYLRALDLDKGVFTVWEQAMTIYAENGQYTALLRMSENALDYFPNRAMAHYFNAWALLETGRSSDAADVVEQAMLMIGKDQRAAALLLGVKAGIAHVQKKHPAADVLFDEAVKQYPASGELLAQYSLSLLARNEYTDKALEMAQQADKLSPGNVAVDHAMGWALLKKKDFAGAKSRLSKALKTNEEELPLLLEHYGDLLYQTGDIDGAVNYWAKAQAKGGRSSLLDKKIADRRWYE